MNCTKCGKEIPEGENKVCEECQKKLLEEIVNDEKETKEEVEKKEETEKKEKDEFKVKSENVKSKKYLSFISCIIFLIILAAVIIGVYFFKNLNDSGNTIGNIRNYGYGAKSGRWIYYLSPNEDSSSVGIFKVRENGKDIKNLYMGGDNQEIVSINVAGNYVYFIGINSSEVYNDSDEIDNKIYRMKTDGSNLEVINDNEINNDCYEIYVINGFVYYIDNNANVAKMKTDGSEKTVVSENGTGYLGITKDYIIYNVTKEEDETSYVTYIMNIDGSNSRPIIKDKRLYSVNIEGDYVYYTNEDKLICRTKIDSNEEEILSEVEAYNLNVNKGFAYFLNYKDVANEDYTVCIYKIDLNSEDKTPTIVKELETYSSFLNIVGDWALYMDSNDTAGFINIVNINTLEVIRLYYLDYEQYYNNNDYEDTDNIEENNATESESNDQTDDATNEIVENTVTESTTEVSNTTSSDEVTNQISNETTNEVENEVQNQVTTNEVENQVQ